MNVKRFCIPIMVILGGVVILVANFYGNKPTGHWEHYQIAEYEWKNSQLEADFSDWINSLQYQHKGNADNSKCMDFDLCIQPWTDTVWNRLQTEVIDSFNLRLHTHSFRNHYLRTINFASQVIGYVRIGKHSIFLYDQYTIDAYFTPCKHHAHFCRYIQDEHGFLDWQDEDVWGAYLDERLRPANTIDGYFYRNEFLFYTPFNHADRSNFMEEINKDTFAMRSTGPYLMLTRTDDASQQQTEANMLQLLRDNFTEEELSIIDGETRVLIVCKVDSLGNVDLQNYSTADIVSAVNRVCKQLPTFLPAHQRGQSVNSYCRFYYCAADFSQNGEISYNKTP